MARAPRQVHRRNRRVEEHLHLVDPLVQHYARCTAEDPDDLRQVALVGLIRAAELYRVQRRVPFSAFARPHIRGAVLHYLRDLAPRVRTPRRVQEALHRLRQVERRLQGDLGREASGLELQSALGLSPQRWRVLQEQLLQSSQLRCWLPPMALEDLASAPATPEPGAPDVLALLQGLETRDRHLLEQVVLRGISLRTMARQQGTSAATVHRHLQRALTQLRLQLNLASAAPMC